MTHIHILFAKQITRLAYPNSHICTQCLYVTSHPALAQADSLPTTSHGAGGSKRRRRALETPQLKKGKQRSKGDRKTKRTKQKPEDPNRAKEEKKKQKGKSAKEKG